MPHDYNGVHLAVGDLVYLPAKVTRISPGVKYCNCWIQPIYSMPPYDEGQTFELSNINTHQLVKQE